MELSKEFFGLLSICMTLVSMLPYIYFTLKGRVRPHAFSWIIWALLTAIGFAAQVSANAGPGSWATATACISCFAIALLSFFKGERHITRSDWITFLAALLAIPLWMITDNPFWSVVWVSLIDTLGYWPTIRKSYYKPQEELMFTHITGIIKYLFALAAIEHFIATNWLYPASICAANLVLVGLLVIRRVQLR